MTPVDVPAIELPPGVEGLPLDEPDAPGTELGDPGQLEPLADDHPRAAIATAEALPGIAGALAVARVLPCPFVRPLIKGAHGQDVVAVKRALVKAGYRPAAIPQTLTFGATLELELKRFQHAHGIQATGKYGAATHHTLTPSFDAWGRHLLALEAAHQHPHPPTGLIHRIVAVALFTLAHPTAIGYSMGSRRMEGVTRHLHPPQLPGMADCSGLQTWDHYAGGGPDPNGRDFDGLGFTGTIAAHGIEVRYPGPPCASILYGDPPNYEHVIFGLGDGSGVSHGTPITKHVPANYRPVGKVVVAPELLKLLAA